MLKNILIKNDVLHNIIGEKFWYHEFFNENNDLLDFKYFAENFVWKYKWIVLIV